MCIYIRKIICSKLLIKARFRHICQNNHYEDSYHNLQFWFMSTQTGSRFTSNYTYQQTPYYTQTLPPEISTPSSADSFSIPAPIVAPIVQNNQSNQMQQVNPYRQSQVPLTPRNNTEFLLAMYTPQERMQVKSQNFQKYQMNPESLIYRLTPRYLENLVKRYPQDFTPQLREDLVKNLGKMRRDYNRFNNLLWGGLLYWVALRRFTWFKLTGKAFMRLSFAFICVNNMMDIGFDVNNYLVQNAFINNLQFEKVLQKYNIHPDTLNKVELYS